MRGRNKTQLYFATYINYMRDIQQRPFIADRVLTVQPTGNLDYYALSENV